MMTRGVLVAMTLLALPTGASADCSCIYQGSRLLPSLYANYPSSDPGKYNTGYDAIDIYGTTCAAWDQMEGTPWKSYCPDNADFSLVANSWCQAPWCYVASSCSSKIASSVFAGSSTAYYSYATCGNTPDCYTNSGAGVTGCPYDPHGTKTNKIHKGGDCACTYQGNTLASSLYNNYPTSNPGRYKDYAGIKNYGTTCAAWDQLPNTPWFSYCPSGSDWCHQTFNWCQLPWCYVNENCNTRIASSVFKGSTTAYYSYDTCLSTPDCYTNSAEADWASLPSACPFDSSDSGWYTKSNCPNGYTGTASTSTTGASSSFETSNSASAAAMAPMMIAVALVTCFLS